IFKVRLDLKGENNSGIEGITYDKNREEFYVVNEKTPTLLIKLDSELNLINKRNLKIAADLSGLSYDDSTDELWIISDENKLIMICNTEGEVKKKFKINIPQIEGIAVDNRNRLIYIVSDYTETLYVFKILLN
ncbi:MAG: SdiA-regulated domain-containing protein, partial [Candidatus Pacebacteria bacterium]|nr:SdiA-regulated domain-containing protein [Candidatus Paceibacterota bacterium]